MFLFKLLKNNGYLPLIEYLHYSMFLFKLGRKERRSYTTIIYITVCFYLNSDTFKSKIYSSEIYITVCFYLNKRKGVPGASAHTFTLQYVSI